jgi:hypothetical protein
MQSKKNSIIDILSKFITPTATLLLTLLSFALLSPKLGFYLDDWPQLYSLIKHGTEGIKEYFLYDGRPFGFWPDLFFYSLWGTNSLLWHLTNYILRWLVGVFFWLILCEIWPNHRREASWAAALFCVFPLFNQQSMGLTFIAHWSCYVLFMLSIYLMILGLKHPKDQIVLLLMAFLVNIPNLFTYENFIGVEFLRPIFIWLALPKTLESKKRLKTLLLYWIPFLVLTLVYIYWRLFLMDNLRTDTSPILFTNFASNPLTTIVNFLTIFVKDILFMILNVWFPVFSTEIIDFSLPSSVLSLGLASIVVLILIGLLIWDQKRNKSRAIENDKFFRSATLLGLVGIVFGCLPSWIIMRSVGDSTGMWNDRFGLAAMFGASLFIVGLLGWFLDGKRLKSEIILAILIGFSVGHNFSVSNDYRWSSIYANRLYSQLYWRAPYLKSGTAILSDNEFLPKFGVYPTSFAINLLYPSEKSFPKLDYWFFTIYKYFPGQVNQLVKGIPITQGHWYSKFETNSDQSIVVAWHPETSQCLWVLTNKDRYNPYLSANTKEALAASNLTQIESDTKAEFPQDLFGLEDKETWCYFYETADLARQNSDWMTILHLYEQANEKNLEPANQIEMMPFIEAILNVGNPAEALNITINADTRDPRIRQFLCDNWDRIAQKQLDNSEVQKAYQTLNKEFKCSKLLSTE